MDLVNVAHPISTEFGFGKFLIASFNLFLMSGPQGPISLKDLNYVPLLAKSWT